MRMAFFSTIWRNVALLIYYIFSGACATNLVFGRQRRPERARSNSDFFGSWRCIAKKLYLGLI
jgi:hypothetical protein